MGLFGNGAMLPQGIGEAVLATTQRMPQPQQDMMKKGLFGSSGAFRPDSPLWKVMGGIGDVISGDSRYTDGLLAQQAMDQRGLMERAQREAENAQWYEREKWKRDNQPPPRNDTIEDYNFLEQRLGREGANQYLRNMADPMVTVPLGDGSFYNGPRSGLGAALGGSQSKPRKLGPIVNQVPGGPAPAPGGFPR